MSSEDVTEKRKRFKHRSYQAQIKDVHLPSPLSQNAVDQELPDDQSHFQVALEQWRQLNLASPFLQFANKSEPLSASLPLLLHNWEAVVDLWIDATNEADLESKQPLLDLLQKLLYDLRTTLTPRYEALWDTLLAQATRSLPPAAFETYIQTLSLFLKYLLLPSPDNCKQTWTKLSGTMRKSRPEVRRKLAEVWGTAFRRLKSETRGEMTDLLLESLDVIQDAVTWVYIIAVQSTSSMVHTSATSLLKMLWDSALAAEDFNAVSRLLRRVLSATMHYCTIESFQTIADLVTTRIKTIRSTPQSEERNWRIMEIALVVCAFRKGRHAESMLNYEQLSSVLETLTFIPLTERLKAQVVALIVACLKGSEISLWAKGRAALEHVWKDTLCGFWLAESLSRLEQSKGKNWKAFILPYVQRHWITGFHLHPSEGLKLLHTLVDDGKINFQDATWRDNVQTACSGLLTGWDLDQRSALQLQHILPLLPQLPGLAPSIIKIVEAILKQDIDARQNHRETATNAGWCLGSCLVALSRADGWTEVVNVDFWFKSCLDKYYWNAKVLQGLVAIADLCHSHYAFTDALEALKTSLMSHSNALRLNALRVLASNAVDRDASQRIAITACLQAEEVDLNGTQTPERILKTTRIGSLALGASTSSNELCIRWLIAQLKINLMPLWKAAAQALVTLVERYGEEVWPIVGDELKDLFTSGDIIDSLPTWAEVSDPERPIQEDEKTWRNPGLQETLIALRDATSDDGMRSLIQSQVSSERLDIGNYEKQILKMLEGCPNFAERHNRDLIPLFLSFAEPEASSSSQRHNLAAWLSLLSKFNNPKAVFASSSVHSIYTSLISHPDRTLRTLAINCTLSFKSKPLMAHEDTIRGLLDDGQWKEHIMSLDLATTVQPTDRAEYVEFLIRLFYGMMRDRRGKNKIHDRRATLIGALRQCTEQELATLVRLMLEPFGIGEHSMIQDNMTVDELPNSLSGKQQVGFLVLLGEVTRVLGTRLVTYFPSLMKGIIAVVAHAQKVLEGVKVSEAEQPIGEPQNDDLDSEEEVDHTPQKVARNLRQLGIKRFTDQFRLPVEFDYRPYLPVAFDSFISCRLETLDSENTQSPSALMELFHAWSTRADQISFLVDYSPTVLPKIYACLVATNVKPSVISRVFDIIEQILTTAPSLEEATTEKLVKSHVTLLIENLTAMIKDVSKSGIISSELSQRQIRILRAISEYVVDKRQASGLLNLILPLLRKPSRVVSESIKVDLLQTLRPLLSLLPTGDQTAEITSSIYEIASHLLQTLRNRQARLAATDVFVALAARDDGMTKLVPLIVALNSFNPRRPQEPDFEQRMEAFAELNERAYAELIPSHWVPILNNMLYFVHDEELSIRNNAAYTMRRFIEMVHTGDSVEMKSLFSKVLFIGLKRGLRSKHELVRAELISLIAYSIKQLSTFAVLQDMVPLLANGDEEVNFFNNIFHVQIHRRTRALRRLADHCEQGQLKSSTLYDIFVPVIGHYIGDSSVDHLLLNEAINTLGRIAQRLIWSRYYALVQQYLKAVKDKGSAEKANLRALVTILDHFHFTMEEVASTIMGDEDDEEEEEAAAVEQAANVKIADAVNARLLPSLLQFMEKREETEDTLRLPIAIGIVKVALHLPQEKQRAQVTRLITILCQALRSKSSETRDMTRDVLCKIAVAIGPSYLVDLVKELRMALTRGPQLHVLAVTCHLLIHHLSQEERRNVFENFDGIAASVAEISTEVIFGHSNKEIQSEENKTTFREMRGASSKGLDSMAILAKHITPVNISSLLAPLRSIMHETESIKIMQQVDETLKRISSGLNSNTSLDPKGLLSLCHTLISQNAKFLQEKPDIRRNNRGKKDVIVQTKRDLPQAAGHYAHNSYRFVAFGLDLFVVAFRRNRFDFQDPDVIARLEPMVSLIGNTLYSSATPVVTLGLKAVAAIIRAPLQSIPKSLPVIIRQQVEIVRQSGSAESELAQAALKSLASTLRDSPTAQLREGDLKLILEIMEPDLEEADRQAAVFALLRSIIQRKLVIPEIYDMLDKVANIVVTNQSSEVQETCRGILLQFLLDYPQGKGRLRKQMTFLASNLSYVFESGRTSVMTLLDAIFRKFEPSLLAEYADLFFMALVMVLANDESAKCREKAAALIKTLYQAMETEERRVTMERLHVWISQGEQAALTSVAAQVYGLIIDVALNDAIQRLELILNDLNHSLERAVEEMEAAAEQSNDSMDIDVDWQPAYHALVVLAKLLKIIPEGSLEDVVTSVSWDNVINLMLYPHAWIRAASTRLLGTFYAALPSPGADTSFLETHPLSREGMIITATNLSIQLRSEHLDLPFSLQIVKNMVFIAKSLHNNQGALVEIVENGGQSDDSGSEDEEDASNDGEEKMAKEESKTARIARAPLPWLFSKLSYQIKTSHLKRRNSFVVPSNWVLEPTAILQWFAAMVSYLDVDSLERYLVHVLTPVYRLLEDDTVRDSGMDDIKATAQELQDLVQSKVGTTKFIAIYGQIRQGTMAIRRERKVARATLAASNPQRAAQRQIQRNIAKRQGRKRKSQAFRENKVLNYPSKKRRVE